MISDKVKDSRRQVKRLLTKIRSRINQYSEGELQELTNDLFKYV